MNINKLPGIKTSLGESPLWDPRIGAYIWLDCLAPCVFSMDWETRQISRFELPKTTGSIVMAKSGGYVIAAEDGMYTLPELDDEPRLLSPLPSEVAARSRYNDGKVDRQGRLLAGTMDLKESEPVGKAFVYDRSGLREVDSGYVVFNGPFWSLDGATLFMSDSASGNVYRFDYDPHSGTVLNKTVFVQIPREEGLPDGATIDSSGNFWQARNGAGYIACHNPDGSLKAKIDIPALNVTSLAFGGPQYRHMLVTSMARALPWQDGLDEGSGSVFLLELQDGSSGNPEPEFIG
jgi:L-arabinonolactonase